MLTDRVVIIVSGLPGAGKSTVSRGLAARFDRGVHIEADRLRDMVIAGNAWPPGEAINPLADEATADEAMTQLALRGRNAALLADSFFEHDFAVVVDEIVIGTRLHTLLSDLRSRPAYLVTLAPSLKVVQARETAREGLSVFDVWKYLDERQRERQDVGLWLDSSDLSPDETVATILERIWDEGRVA